MGLLGNYNGVAAKVAKYALNSHYLKPVLPNTSANSSSNNVSDPQSRVIDAPKIIQNSTNNANVLGQQANNPNAFMVPRFAALERLRPLIDNKQQTGMVGQSIASESTNMNSNALS